MLAQMETASDEGQNGANGGVPTTGVADNFVGGAVFLASKAKGNKGGEWYCSNIAGGSRK